MCAQCWTDAQAVPVPRFTRPRDSGTLGLVEAPVIVDPVSPWLSFPANAGPASLDLVTPATQTNNGLSLRSECMPELSVLPGKLALSVQSHQARAEKSPHWLHHPSWFLAPLAHSGDEGSLVHLVLPLFFDPMS